MAAQQFKFRLKSLIVSSVLLAQPAYASETISLFEGNLLFAVLITVFISCGCILYMAEQKLTLRFTNVVIVTGFTLLLINSTSNTGEVGASSAIYHYIIAVGTLLSVFSYSMLGRNQSKAIRMVSAIIGACLLGVFFLHFANKSPSWLMLAEAVTILVSATLIVQTSSTIKSLIHTKVDNEGSKEDSELAQYAYDVVTQLPNQQQALLALSRQLTEQSSNWQVIVFKPLNFQQFNTVLGHENADLLLLQLTFALQQKVAAIDDLVNLSVYTPQRYIARLQSLNFLIVVDASNTKFGLDSLLSQTEQILSSAIPTAFSFKQYTFNFELAFGVCSLSSVENNITQAINFAGDALTESVKANKTLTVFDKDHQLFASAKLHMMAQLSQALEKNELRLYFQPQINLGSHRIMAIEALLRWSHPTLGELDANKFIDLAVDSGVIIALTDWVITQSLEAVCYLKANNINLPVAINLSSKELLQPELLEQMMSQLEHKKLASNQVIVEIKEQALINSKNSGWEIIQQLNHSGIAISLDDFTGSLSSLEYLRTMKMRYFKLDCSSLNQTNPDTTDYAITAALLNLAKQLDISPIALNIETEQAERSFRHLGGVIGQGFHYAKPMPLEMLLDWHRRWSLKHPTT